MKNQQKFTELIPQQPTNTIENDYFTLDNGLKVVLQQDFSTQKIAVNVQYHVGSAMERPGLTGVTHLIEHLQFTQTEHLARFEYNNYIDKMGGECGAYTSGDRTVFHPVIPRDALERILWLESDRMGFFINAITKYDIDREIEIVTIEKHDTYDNRLYGNNVVIINSQIYPEGHPYHWIPLGNIADLKTLTLEELKQYYATYFVPNNATLTLVGDFDIPLAKKLIQKYFGEIKGGISLPKPAVQNVELSAIKKLVWEAPYIVRPRISFVFPMIDYKNKDANAFRLFINYFFNFTEKPLNHILKHKNLASYCIINHQTLERAGFFQYEIRALEGVDLNEIAALMDDYIAKFEEEGVNDVDLNDLKKDYLSDFNKRIADIKELANMISYNTEFIGKPDAFFDSKEKSLSVSKEDIMNIYTKYIKGKPYLVLSMVPEGKSELAVKGSIPIEIKIEKLEERTFVAEKEWSNEVACEKSESSFDRNIVPDFLPNTPILEIPTVWTSKLKNGMQLFGITKENLPNIEVNITIKGGMLFDPPGKTGVSYFNSELMVEGTQLKSRAQLVNKILSLDAEIKVSSETNFTRLNIKSSVQNFSEIMLLVEEILLQPRFDEESFERIRNRTKSTIKADLNSQKTLTSLITQKLLLGTDSPLAYPSYMTHGNSIESIDSITMDDIKSYYFNFINPTLTDITIVGPINQSACEQAFSSLVEKWTSDKIELSQPISQSTAQKNKIYFVDFPNSTHSTIRISKLTNAYTPAEELWCEMINYYLGWSRDSMLKKIIINQKGFANKVISGFYQDGFFNYFLISTYVPASVTKETLEILNNTLENYAANFNETILEKTKTDFLRKRLFTLETPEDYMELLNKIAKEGLPLDYFKQQEEIIRNLTLQEAKEVIAHNINPTELIYLVVGDAKTQLEPLNSLGMGGVILLDREGKEI